MTGGREHHLLLGKQRQIKPRISQLRIEAQSRPSSVGSLHGSSLTCTKLRYHVAVDQLVVV